LLWMEDLWNSGPADGKEPAGSKGGAPATTSTPLPATQAWPLARKFLDYLEANAEDYWQVPQFEMAAEAMGDGEPRDDRDDELPEFGRAGGDEFSLFDDEDEDEEGDEDNGLFGAAYEGVSYRDSTDDGIDGDMSDGGPSTTDFELVGEAERIVSRLTFLTTVAQLWRLCATAVTPLDVADRDEVLAGWLAQAEQNKRQLSELLAAVHRHRIASPRGTQESLMDYDRRRSVKETLMEEIIQTCVETIDATRIIRASMTQPAAAVDQDTWEEPAGKALAAIMRGDADGVREVWSVLLRTLLEQPLLYVAIRHGGNPQRIVSARAIQFVLRRFLNCLPRLGLLTETCRLLETAHQMEMRHPVGPGGVTEFDRVFEIACRSITECLAISSAEWPPETRPAADTGQKGSDPFSAARTQADDELIDRLEQLIEVLLRCWLSHSRGVRLSVLESVNNQPRWEQLRRFIETYGGDLFTQDFMNPGNLRGILHQGVGRYLAALREESESDAPFRLIDDLDVAIPLDEAADLLELTIEAVVENYGEYMDYNSITTQSDRGEMLYTLLDFLRLAASYDRLAWNLRPVAIAHEALIRCGRESAADIWRRAVTERTSQMANEHQKRFERLCKTYGMRLPSIAEHLAERFIRPLEIDRLCSLIRLAVEELREGRPPAAMDRLEAEIAQLTRQTLGAGIELPTWLEALEEEVEHIQWQAAAEDDETLDPNVRIVQVRLSREELDRQLHQMMAGKPRKPGP
jgi:hypothetical protein